MAELDSNPKSIQSLYSWYAEEKLWVNRRYQRKLVWTLHEKQKLVESVLRRYPIPAILLAERENGEYEVIDGLQRLHTLMSFVETSFAAEDGRFFDVSQYPTANTRASEGVFEVERQNVLVPREIGTYLDYAMAVSVMRGATDAEIDEVFSRINTYGHRLSDQERRQAGVQNDFSNLVRRLSGQVRGDVSRDVLQLADMPSISIDMPMTRHGYNVSASDVFWVEQGILRSTDLRDSMDEQCVADIVASVVGGSILARSKDALDEVYRENSDESRRITASLSSYGPDRFTAEFKFVIGELRTLCGTGVPVKLRSLLFSRQTSNPFPAVFTVLTIALHELLVVGDKKISDYEGLRNSLRNLDRRVDTSRGSTSPDERRQNVNTIKGLVGPHLVPAEQRDLYDDQTIMDVDEAIQRSEIEAPHYELKQGILRLDETRAVDPGVLSKILRTICAIANNGTARTGALFVGVADRETDAARVRQLYGISPRRVGRKYVVGVRREADFLGESLESYFGRFKTAIANSGMSAPLKSSVLASLNYTDYFGLGVIIVNVPPQADVSLLDGSVFTRSGDETVEVSGLDLLDVGRRFAR